MKYVVLIFIYLSMSAIGGHAVAQSPMSMKIGSYLPEVAIKVWHHGQEEVRTLRPNGKPLIMDFGTTTCPPCIKAYNHLNEVFPELEGSMDVYFVTRQPLDAVKKFFGRPDLYDQLNVPIIYADTVLHELFEHASQPHIVWLDAASVLRHTTHHTQVQADYVRRFSRGEKLSLERKNDFPFDYAQPLSVVSNAQLLPATIPRVISTVTLTDQIDGVLPAFRTYPADQDGMVRMLAINLDVVTIFRKLYELAGVDKGIDPSRILVEDAQGNVLAWDEALSWLYTKKYSLETYSESRMIHMDKSLVDAFSHAFGIKVRFENRQHPAWVIKDLPAGVIRLDPKDRSEQKASIYDFLYFYNNGYGQLPLLNYSSIQRSAIYWKIFALDRADFGFLPIKEVLEERGLTLVEETRLVPFMVIQLP